MKTVKIIEFILIVFLVCIHVKNDGICCCGSITTNVQDTEYDKFSEDRLETLSDLGYSQSEIEEMEKEGIPEDTEEFLKKTESVKRRLKNKYGIEFRVNGGYLNSFLVSDRDVFYCYAKEGSLMDKKFYVKIDEDGNTEEGYSGLLEAEILESFLNNQYGTEYYKISLYTRSLVDFNTCDNGDQFKEEPLYVRLCFKEGISHEEIASLGRMVDEHLKKEGYNTDITVYRGIPEDVFNKINPWWDNNIMGDYH